MTFLDHARRITQEAMNNGPEWFDEDWLAANVMDAEDARLVAVFNPATINTLLNAVEAAQAHRDHMLGLWKLGAEPKAYMKADGDGSATAIALDAALAAVRDALPAKEPADA